MPGNTLSQKSLVVRLDVSYYASLCWYGLQQLGFAHSPLNPQYASWAEKMEDLGATFDFRPPIAGGPLFTFVYQIPGYLNPADPAELGGILEAVKDFLHSADLEAFTRWPDKTQHWDKWYHAVARQRMREQLAGQEASACQLLDLWFEFMAQLWPLYREIYTCKLRGYPFDACEERANRVKAFEEWQHEYHLDYPYTVFDLVICPENPTYASSLGPEKVVFSAMHGWGDLRHALVHELGVRFPGLHRLAENPEVRLLMEEDELGVLKLLEAEVCVRKRRLLPDLDEDVFERSMRLERLVAWRAAQKVNGNFLADFASLYRDAREANLL
jgi:hypothetical protein